MTMFSRSARLPSVQIASLDTLTALLPRVLDSLSISRGQMLLDQLTVAVRSNRIGGLVLLVAQEEAVPDNGPAVSVGLSRAEICVRAAAILQISHASEGQTTATTANVLYAGPIDIQFFQTASVSEARFFGSLLAEKFDEILSRRGVRFIQWAQDLSASCDSARGGVPPATMSLETLSDGENVATIDTLASDSWSEYLGFRRLAELLYLRRELMPQTPDPGLDLGTESWRQSGPLLLKAMSDGNRASSECESLVERTYAETLDCPELSGMQTTPAILDGYRASPAFAADLWFEARLATIKSASADPSDPVAGCLILAKHMPRPSETDSTDSTDDHQTGGVLELVYMGIVPEHRGRGLGARLVELTEKIARRERCESVILAVDTRNHPARVAYEAAGFVPILSEQVWGKRLLRRETKASKNDST